MISRRDAWKKAARYENSLILESVQLTSPTKSLPSVAEGGKEYSLFDCNNFFFAISASRCRKCTYLTNICLMISKSLRTPPPIGLQRIHISENKSLSPFWAKRYGHFRQPDLFCLVFIWNPTADTPAQSRNVAPRVRLPCLGNGIAGNQLVRCRNAVRIRRVGDARRDVRLPSAYVTQVQ